MRRGLFALVATFGFALGLPGIAAAGDGPSLRLAAQTPWILIGGDARIDLAVRDAPDDAEIQLTVHDAVTSRSAFEQTIRGEDLGGIVKRVAVPFSATASIDSGLRRVVLGTSAPELATPDRVPIAEPGVYPLVVSLISVGDSLDEFVTDLVVVGGDGSGPAFGERLRVAWVWPLAATPSLAPDGSLSDDALAELGASGRVGRQADALARAGTTVTVAPSPASASDWLADDTSIDTSDALRSITGARNQVLSSPYVPIDAPSLVAGGFGFPLSSEYALGHSSLEKSFDRRVDPRTAVPTSLDPTSFLRLSDANVDRVVTDEASLEEQSSTLTPARPFTLEEDGRHATAAVADSGLEEFLDGDETAALRAQWFLADLTLIATEAPNRTRGVVVVNPDSWNPDPDFLAASLDGLRTHPLLSAVTLDGYFDQVPTETDDRATRTLADGDPPPPPVDLTAYQTSADRQDAFRSFVGADSPSLDAGNRALLVSLSSMWIDRGAANTQLGLVDSTIDDFLARIRSPVGNRVTLTARTGSIPVTILNETGEQVVVRVSLDSDKLSFPEGSVRDVDLAPRATTERFAVETRTPGRFPLVLTVSSPDGRLVVSSTRVEVRSTAVSGVGVFLTIGAGTVLAGWWLNDVRRRRRARKERADHATGLSE